MRHLKRVFDPLQGEDVGDQGGNFLVVRLNEPDCSSKILRGCTASTMDRNLLFR